MSTIDNFLRILGISVMLKSGGIENNIRSESISVRLQSNDAQVSGSGGGGTTHGPSILMETSGYVLMETGDYILLE